MPEWNPPHPTAAEAYANTELPAWRPETQFAFAAWLPQVGGYASTCRVVFDRETNCRSFDNPNGGPGCFDVSIYHDGDFPQDARQAEFHFCCPMQFIRFGIDVLAQMAKHQSGGMMRRSERDDLIARLAALPVVEG